MLISGLTTEIVPKDALVKSIISGIFLVALKYDEDNQLKYHQFIVDEFIKHYTDQRGILICHSMGQGKTRIAVSIATNVLKYEKNRRIIVLSAKSLAENFKKEVIEYTKLNSDYVDKNFKFISLNASNMYKQFTNMDKSAEEIALEKQISSFLEDIKGKNMLENSLLIIDESHNLFNSITNGANNAVSLYDLIMRTKNIKLIFLSGTPLINHPFELVPCFNMLRGYISLNYKSKTRDLFNYVGGAKINRKELADEYTTLFS